MQQNAATQSYTLDLPIRSVSPMHRFCWWGGATLSPAAKSGAPSYAFFAQGVGGQNAQPGGAGVRYPGLERSEGSGFGLGIQLPVTVSPAFKAFPQLLGKQSEA